MHTFLARLLDSRGNEIESSAVTGVYGFTPADRDKNFNAVAAFLDAANVTTVQACTSVAHGEQYTHVFALLLVTLN